MLLLCSKFFDPVALDFVSDQTIVVDETSGLIADVRKTSSEDLQAEKSVDLRKLTVLPGLVDCHVHLFLYPYAITSWADQVTKESIPERTIRAVNHARETLLSGFTTVRDLGTEGALDADIALRKCISSPVSVTPDPRYFCVTRAIVSTGSYGPKSTLEPSSQNVDGAMGADIADGLEECRKVVRRQIGAGADWIKIYADYRFRSRLAGVNSKAATSNLPLFTDAELEAMIEMAHSLGVKVAAHASMAQQIKTLSRLGVDSIEHGYEADLEALEAMSKYGVIWVPTLGAYYTMRDSNRGYILADNVWEMAQKAFKMALKVPGLKIAVGGDTGVFAHGTNALEMKLMLELGMDWKDVLKAATLTAWMCIRGPEWDGPETEERIAQLAEMARSDSLAEKTALGDNHVPFGVIKPGYAADIVATSGNLEERCSEAIDAQNIQFVMKAGKVYKADGKAV